MTDLKGMTRLVPRPAASDINGGLSPLKPATVIGHLGAPRTTYSQDCRPVTNPTWKRRIVTADVGPFNVTGLDVAVRSLAAVMARVKGADPTLYAALETAGMLCCRLVRGAKHTLSNHSFGCAVDITVGGRLDQRGDGLVQAGLLRLYAHFHAEGWYWGAEYPTEDGMHYELANETFVRLMKGGKR